MEIPLLHVWFDHGHRPRMPVSVSLCCQTCLIRSHRKDQLCCSTSILLQYLMIICKCSAFQCLVLTNRIKWTFRKVPKVAAFRSFARLPSWCRKPEKMTYHLCAEDLTKTTIVPNLPEEERLDNKSIEREVECRTQRDDTSLSSLDSRT